MDIIITIQNTQPAPVVIPGVLVRVFVGAVLETQGTTDVDGQVNFVLDEDTYTIWCGKTGVSFSNPYSVIVMDPVVPPDTNNFTLSAEELADPIASDANFCRCWGYFIDGSGFPFKGVAVWLWALVATDSHTNVQHLLVDVVRSGTPSVVGDVKGIIPSEKLELITNENGFGWIDLARTGTYIGRLRGAHVRDPVEFTVPDTSGTNILNLLLPFILSINYDPIAPYSLSIGATLELDLTLILSNGDEAGDAAHKLLEVTSSNSSLATAEISSNNVLKITGVGLGIPVITLTPKVGILPMRFPVTTFSFEVTVT